MLLHNCSTETKTRETIFFYAWNAWLSKVDWDSNSRIWRNFNLNKKKKRRRRRRKRKKWKLINYSPHRWYLNCIREAHNQTSQFFFSSRFDSYTHCLLFRFDHFSFFFFLQKFNRSDNTFTHIKGWWSCHHDSSTICNQDSYPLSIIYRLTS